MSKLINMNGGFYCDSEYKNINHSLDFSGFNLGQHGGGDEYKNKFIASGLYVKYNQFGGAEEDEPTEMFGNDVVVDVEQHPNYNTTEVKISLKKESKSERDIADKIDTISNDMLNLSQKIKIQKKEKE